MSANLNTPRANFAAVIALCTKRAWIPALMFAAGLALPSTAQAQPLNDNCASATFVFGSEVVINGTTNGASGVDESGCGTSDVNDVWYTWSAPCSGPVTVSLCTGTTLADTTLTVYDNCPDFGGVELACNDNFCGQQSELVFQATSFFTYIFRVAGVNATTGDFTLSITCPPTGACCISPGEFGCQELSADDCAASFGIYQGDDTTCGADSCSTSACCNTDGTCLTIMYDQFGTPVGATCNPPNLDLGAGTDCETSTCPSFGACCVGNTICSIETQEDCDAIGVSVYLGDGSDCSSNPCETGACCDPSTEPLCINLSPFSCNLPATYLGDGTDCANTGCPGFGACCTGGGVCQILSEADCGNLNGNYLGDQSSCALAPCSTGACCDLLIGTCTEVDATMTGTECPGPDFTYQGDGITCAAALCPGAGDDCAGVIIANNGPNVVDLNDATSSELPVCPEGFPVDNGASDTVENDLFYGYTATCTGILQIDTCGSGVDTRLAIYPAGANCGDINNNGVLPLICDDDQEGEGPACGGFLESSLELQVNQGDTFVIRVGTFDEAPSTAVFNMNIVCVVPPSNDNCLTATPINCGDTLLGQATIGAFNDFDPTTAGCTGDAAASSDVAYEFVSPTDQVVTVSTLNASFDTSIYAVTDCFDVLNSCVAGADNVLVAGDESFVFLAQANVTYFIIVDGFGAEEGTFDLSVQCQDPTPSACCQPDGGCTLLLPADCAAGGGLSLGGPLATCTDVICPPVGACCVETAPGMFMCTVGFEDTCDAAGGTYLGNGTNCDLPDNGGDRCDCNGNGMLDTTELAGGTFPSTDTPIGIPDGPGGMITSVINITSTDNVLGLDVGLQVTHTFLADLEITLEHDGVSVDLFFDNCGGDNDMDIILDDDGAPLDCTGDGPLVGIFIPDNALSAFNGTSVGGAWTLTVVDDAGIDTGTLQSWSLIIQSDGDGATDCNGNAIIDECEIPNPNSIGGCCQPGNTCTIETEVDCDNLGGFYLGNCTDCGILPEGQYQLVMNDTFGDAWNGATIDIFVNGISATGGPVNFLDDGSGDPPGVQLIVPFFVAGMNPLITTTFVGGTFDGEITWQILTPTGDVVCSDGPNPDTTPFRSCGGSPCATAGACCTVEGCIFATRDACEMAGNIFVGEGTDCSTDPCNNGACCLTSGGCDDSGDQTDCDAQGGFYQGNGSICANVECPPVGACCSGAGPFTCSVTFQNNCEMGGGVYLGDGTNCTPLGGTTDRCDCNGNDIVDFEEIPGGVFPSTDTPIAIPDGPGGTIMSVLNTAASGTISDLNVSIQVTHTFLADLEITLEHDGVSVDLFFDNCGGDDNMDIIFDDDGLPLDCTGTGPIVGTFQPDNPLAAFNGTSASGVWTLTIVDDAGADTGTLDSWSLEITATGTGTGSDCDRNGILDECQTPDPSQTGACCLPNGSCLENSPTDCANQGGEFQGGCTLCIDIVCAPVGACCTGPAPFTCEVTFRSVCENGGGTYLGDNSDCTPLPPTTDRCDCNGNDIVDIDEVAGGTFSSSDTPIAIPDGPGGTIMSVLNVGAGGTITDVNVGIQITHTFIGDMEITLEHDGVSVDLWFDNCLSEDNMDVVLDDGAPAPVCPGAGLPVNGTFGPDNPLSAFNGLTAGGVWTLTIVDDAGADIGTLDSWSLIITTSGSGLGSDCDANGVLDECQNPDPSLTGGCCVGAACSIELETDCTMMGGNFLGGCSDCSQACPGVEACCFTDGTCQDLLFFDCVGMGGTAQGANTTCFTIICPPPPATNDECDLGIVEVFDGSTAVSLDTATSSGQVACGDFPFGGAANATVNNDLWYEYTATCTGQLFVDTCGTADDTRLAVYNVDCAAINGGALPVECNDDHGNVDEADTGNTCDAALAAALSFPVVQGETYIIRVGSFSTTTPAPLGLFNLNIACAVAGGPEACCFEDGTCQDLEPGACAGAGGTAQGFGSNCGTTSCPLPPSGNDECDANIVEVFNGSTPVDLSDATSSGQDASSCDYPFPTDGSNPNPNNDLWYEYTATCTGTLFIDTCGSAADTRLAVYDVNCAAIDGGALPVECNDDHGQALEGDTGNTCPDTFSASLSLPAVQGQTYIIRVGSFAAGTPSTLTFDLNIDCVGESTGCDLLGDLNDDTFVDGLDIQGFVDCVVGGGTNCVCADYDETNGADLNDVGPFVADLLGTTFVACACPGDVNGDGLVDGADVADFTSCLILGMGDNCGCAELDGVDGLDDADLDLFVEAVLAGPGCASAP